LKENGEVSNARENDQKMSDRSYLGGKNNIAQFHTRKNCRKENKIAIDVDITAAYCRAFGCIPAADFNKRSKKFATAEEYNFDIFNQYKEEMPYTKLAFFDTKYQFDKKVFEPCMPQKTK
jgi:hypothetical protein